MKKARRCDSCHAHVTPKTTNCRRVHLTTRAFVVSDWSRNSASLSCTIAASVSVVKLSIKSQKVVTGEGSGRTLWKTCSLRISCNLPFRSRTFCAISLSFPLSALSIELVSPIAKSKFKRTLPWGAPPESHPPDEAPDGVKQMRWSPESAAEKVNLPVEPPRVLTTRWSLSKVSSTVTVMARSVLGS